MAQPEAMHSASGRIVCIVSMLACLAVGYLVGHESYEVPSLSALANERTAELYDLGGGISSDNHIGSVDVSELTPLFAAATWKSGEQRIHKGEFQLVFQNGLHIGWRLPGWYFVVRGWPGHFVFPEGMREEVRGILDRLFDEKIIPWRQEKGPTSHS